MHQRITTFAVIVIALLNHPLSLDVDDAANDQSVTSLNVSADQSVAIQIFGRDIQNANGLATRFEYDANQVAYEGFDVGNVLPNAQVLPEEGTIRFRTTASFSGTSIRLVRGELGRGGQFERVMLNASVELQSGPAAPSPDFDGDGEVGFSDFVQFAGAFGTRSGEGNFNAKFDLDGDGEVGFGDFVIFASDFGEEVSSPPSSEIADDFDLDNNNSD